MDLLLPGIYKVYRDKGSGGWGYSYLIKRASGNILLARLAKSATIKDEFGPMAAAGGVSQIYITDHHFAGSFCGEVSEYFQAPILYCAAESDQIGRAGFTRFRTFDYQQQFLEPDVEVIPTPGHTAGGVCYLWDAGPERCLFTGDFLYRDQHGWVVGSKNWNKVKDSIERIMNLDFDYLVGCGDENLGVPYIALPPADRAAFVKRLKEAMKP